MGEVCLLPVSRGKLVGVVLSQARSFQVLLTSLGLLYLWTDSFTSSWWQTVAGTVSTLVLVVFATEYAEEVVKELGRCWRNPQRFFLLVTEDGFFEQSEGGQFAMVWEGIESVRYTSKNYESHIYLDTRTTAVPRFTEGTFRNRDICGFSSLVCFGLMEVEAALDWGRSYAADRWNWSILDGGRATDPLSCMAQPRPHLVLVGISAYKHFEQMPGAADVALVRSLFPRGGDGTPVELADPTLDEFEAQLALAFAAGRHGTIVLYFSGHGMKSSSGDLYLCLPQTDPGRRAATAFPVFKLLALKAEMKVAALVLILDCCYSGAGADGLRLSLDEMDPTMSVLWDSERAGLTILAAGGREQVTFAGDTSTFTRELVSEGKRLLDSQGVVRVGDLFRATARRMETVGLPGRVRLFSGEPGSQCVLCNVMAHLQSQRAASQQRIEQNREFLKREAHAVLNRLHSAKGVLGPGIYATPSGGQLVRTAYSPGIQGFVLLRRIAWIVCIAILATSFASDDFSLIEATVMCFGVVVLAGMLSVMLEVDRAAPLFLLVTPLGVVLQTRLERIVYAAEEIRDVRYHKRETPPVYNSYNTSPVTLISVTLVVEGGHAKDLLSDAYKWPLSVDKLFKLLRKAVADYRLVNGEVSCSQKV